MNQLSLEKDLASAFIIDMFHVIDACEWDKMHDFFDENITYERPGYDPFIGINQLLHFYQYDRVIASGTHYIDHIVLKDQVGACWGRFIGLGRDQSSIDECFVDTYLFENNKIKQRKSYFFRPAI
jgi:hypothetical protein